MALTEPLHEHHKYCDDLFAGAEAAAAAGDWPAADARLAQFREELENHFHTEETLLFPSFEAATGMIGGPTQVMRLEHAQMRELVEQMERALERREGSGFAGAAETLLILMQQHNLKEENILYPMCDRGLASQAEALGTALQERLKAKCLTSD
ncbi:MAG: hemerythrin domain-containing protein [Rhodocyclaceae bacterium]|nr:hemerythrin domain-containing protein [Rhodocyclaceae bacterium]